MKPYCETVAQVVLPTIRALVAKELIEKYKFTQQDAAAKLGLTQSAISQYLRNLRGSKIKILEKDKKISKEIEIFASRIASGEVDSSNILVPFCNWETAISACNQQMFTPISFSIVLLMYIVELVLRAMATPSDGFTSIFRIFSSDLSSRFA